MSKEIGYPDKIPPHYLWLSKHANPNEIGYTLDIDVVHYCYINGIPYEMYYEELHTCTKYNSTKFLIKSEVVGYLIDKEGPNYAIEYFTKRIQIPWFFVFHTVDFTDFRIFEIKFIDAKNFDIIEIGYFSSEEYLQFLRNLKNNFMKKHANN